MDRKRIRLAFVLAPLSAAVVMAAAGAVTGRGKWDEWLVVFLFSLGTFVVAGLLGIPAFHLYLRRGVRSASAYALGGAGIGIITAIATLLLAGATGDSDVVRMALLFMCAGGLSALVFRAVAGVGA